MKLPGSEQVIPSDWGLSPQTAALLSKEPEILKDLAWDRKLPAFPSDYLPTSVEVLFDDIPCIRSFMGEITYMRDCEPDYQPLFVEYRFDDEIALFHVNGEYVVNRIEAMARKAHLNRLFILGGN